ncbi:MAG TPA: hypothetical protein VKH64_13860 [Candidatus Binatia bacterium]|nr:hypothetical protein [Candidatus Binatia bacterium]
MKNSPTPVDSDERRSLAVKFVIAALLILGAALRLWQYAANTSLWLDEIGIARNILERPLGMLLTTPLAYSQAAPKGFLLAEKAAVTLLGPSEYTLRLFPLLCSLAALILFPRVAQRAVVGFAAPIAVTLFAVATPFVFYAAQAKQYSTDVLAAVVLLWIALDIEKTEDLSPRRALWAALVGAVFVWFSYAAVFILAGIGLSLAAQSRRLEKDSARRLCAVLAIWGVSTACVVGAELLTMSERTREYMNRFWARAMQPINPLRGVATFWPVRQLNELFGSGGPGALAYPASILYLSLTALGLALLFRRRRGAALFLILPIGLAVAAAAARQYPFSDRLLLFLVPGFLLAIAEAIEWTRLRAAEFSPVAAVALLVAFAAPALYRIAVTPPVYRIQDVKPALAYMQARRRPGDAVYVYWRGGASVAFYGARFGLRPGDYVSGGCHLGDSRSYLEELDRFRGAPRVWLVTADVSPIRRPPDDLIRYLEAIGARIDSFVVPSRTPTYWNIAPSGVYLYDLSDPARLAQAEANSFPVIINIHWPAWMRCEDGPAMADPARR